jgi:hypothetical protein
MMMQPAILQKKVSHETQRTGWAFIVGGAAARRHPLQAFRMHHRKDE